VGILDHRARILYPEKCITTFLQHAEKNGAKVLENSRVETWSEETDGVKVKLEDGTVIHAGKVIFTVGAWTEKILKDASVPLRATR
jgi:glycine/D-amino acid oxidase-like deaminating enzyme